MTKTELHRIARAVYERNYARDECRLYQCRAWYCEDLDLQAVALRSYCSLVAVYWRGTVWEFDHWSNTTTSHVRKFAHFMDAPVVSLYRRSGMSKRDFEHHEKCDWQDVIQAVLDTL